jgi:hypothetical protein
MLNNHQKEIVPKIWEALIFIFYNMFFLPQSLPQSFAVSFIKTGGCIVCKSYRYLEVNVLE